MAVKRYKFVLDYRAGDNVWTTGQIGEFDEDYAAWLNRDVPGCLEPVEEPKPKKAEPKDDAETRAADAPPADRMHRAPAGKREG